MSGAFTPTVKAAIKEREAGCCASCGRPVESIGWVHQHRRARGMGGSKLDDTGSPANGVLQCSPCNVYTEAHPSWALWAGYRVPQGCDPSLVPLWHARYGWCLLNADATYTPVDDPAPEETQVTEAFSRLRLDAGQSTVETAGVLALAAVAGAGTGAFAAWLCSRVGIVFGLAFLVIGGLICGGLVTYGSKR